MSTVHQTFIPWISTSPKFHTQDIHFPLNFYPLDIHPHPPNFDTQDIHLPSNFNPLDIHLPSNFFSLGYPNPPHPPPPPPQPILSNGFSLSTKLSDPGYPPPTYPTPSHPYPMEFHLPNFLTRDIHHNQTVISWISTFPQTCMQLADTFPYTFIHRTFTFPQNVHTQDIHHLANFCPLDIHSQLNFYQMDVHHRPNFYPWTRIKKEFEGSRPERCIASMIYIVEIHHSGRKPWRLWSIISDARALWSKTISNHTFMVVRPQGSGA